MYLFITIPVRFISYLSALPAQWPFNSSTGVPTNRSTCKISLLVYLHASLSSNHKDLPVTTTTCVHVHRCTRSGPYAFIFMLSFRLTVQIYPSTVILFYMSTDVPVRFISSFSAYTTQWPFNSSTGVPTHRSNQKYIYSHASLSSNHKDLPVTTTICVPAHICTRSWPYLFIFILSLRLTV